MTIDDLIQNQIDRIGELQANQIIDERSNKSDFDPIFTSDQSKQFALSSIGTIKPRSNDIVFIPGLISQEISILKTLVQIKLSLVQCEISISK